MNKENPLREKSDGFSLQIIALCKTIKDQRELRSQLLRSGTSIGANIEEANQAQSKKDFLSKLSIALKEAYASHYWLRLIRDSQIISPEDAANLLGHNEELIKILISSIKSTKVALRTTKKEEGKLVVS